MRKVASTAALGASGTNSAENSRPGTSSGLVKRPRTASSDQSDSEKEKEKEKTGPISEGNMLALAPHLVKLMKETITKFRTLVKRGKADKVLRQWGKRLYEVVLESTGSDEYKSAALLEFFESELGHLWLYCKYVALVLELFADFGTAPRSNFGSYRVELLVMLFDRIIDLHNFEIIISVLTAEEQAAVHARIGILNFFNPCKPEGSWSFDLTRWEERQVVMILVHLSIVEPGDNWVEGTVSFHFDRGFPKTPGWGLTTTWLDNELPNKGMLSFEFFAGGGTRLTSCCVDMKLRHKLASLCLAGQRDYELEIRRREMLYEEKTVAFKLGDVMPHNTYPELYRPGAARPILAHLKLLTQYPIIASISEHTQRTNLDVTLQEVHQLAIEQQEKEVQDEGANALISYGDSDLVIKPYTVEDCNKHLIDETDIKWNYSDANNAKYESWLPKH